MNTPDSFYIVISIAASIFALSIYQLLGIVNIGSNVLFCFSISALLFSLNSFFNNFHLKTEKANKIWNSLKLGLQIIAVVLMICGPYIIKAQNFDNMNNFISLLSLSIIILTISISDLKKYDSEKRMSDIYKTGFLKQLTKDLNNRNTEATNNSNDVDS